MGVGCQSTKRTLAASRSTWSRRASPDGQTFPKGALIGWAATFLASPYARFISGHTLVVDGANWQRRLLTNPPVVTVREQMGKGPFEP